MVASRSALATGGQLPNFKPVELLATSGQPPEAVVSPQKESEPEPLATEPELLSTSGQPSKDLSGQPPSVDKLKDLKPLSTSGQKRDDLKKPPQPALPDAVHQVSFEWRGGNHKTGDSWTLYFRVYKVVSGKKKWVDSAYVFYISIQQWERLKTYDRDKQRNYIQADFVHWWTTRGGHWWQVAEKARAAGTANGTGQ